MAKENLQDNEDDYHEIVITINKQTFTKMLPFLSVILIIFGLIFLVWGLIDYFDQPEETANIQEGIKENRTGEILEGISAEKNEQSEVSGENTDNIKEDGVIDVTADSNTNDQAEENDVQESISTKKNNGKGQLEQREEKSQAINKNSKTPEWIPNDYVFGDIEDATYEVIYGDTLWEIAEGYYGDGDRWVEILEKNLDIVSFLPNGEQALIFPGQVLSL